jgi:hypothetical protein
MTFIITAIIAAIILGIAILYSSLSWGLVMYNFWSWFLLPVFPTLPNITFNQAIGLAMFIALFHNVQSQIIKKEYKDETQERLVILIAPWITLAFGWVIQLFI